MNTHSTAELVELKPCPFCDALTAMLEQVPDEPELWRVRCQECGLQTRRSVGPEVVVSLWNTRAEAADRLQHQDRLNGWQPIETAPSDETPVLLWHRLWKRGISQGFFDAERNWWRISDEAGNVIGVGIFPSHWMPLPEPPALTQSGNE
jgi:hypothetical protein